MQNLSITLWVNENKKEERHPDYTATIKIGDKFEDVGAGWKKISPTTGKKFLSLSFKSEVIKQAFTAMQQVEAHKEQEHKEVVAPPSDW